MQNILISNLISSMQTNYKVKNKYAKVKYNKSILKILYFLKKYGYISLFKVNHQDKSILIFLKYFHLKPLILGFNKYTLDKNIKIMSYNNLKKLAIKHPYFILSTNKGLMFAREASLAKISGFPLFEFKI